MVKNIYNSSLDAGHHDLLRSVPTVPFMTTFSHVIAPFHSSSKPILVRQYSTHSSNQGGNQGDQAIGEGEGQKSSGDSTKYPVNAHDRDEYYKKYEAVFSQTIDNQESGSDFLLERQYKAYQDLLNGVTDPPTDYLDNVSVDTAMKDDISKDNMEGQSEATLTHTDSEGKANMVDVGDKPITKRVAVAEGSIFLGQQAFSLVEANRMKKGDVLSVAQIAGIMAAKKTSALIPLCHDLRLSKVDVHFRLDRKLTRIVARAEARTSGPTGVEMEALTAVSVSLLTVYDMCKAVTHDMTIDGIRLLSKEGGQRGTFIRKPD